MSALQMDLGGPGAPCSKSRVRRLLAGELAGDERAKVAAHLLTCERCRAAERELQAERDQLLRDVPFEAFASNVAERLAKSEPQRPRFMKWAPLLAAASVLIIAVPVGLKVRSDAEQAARGERTKGEVPAVLYVREGDRVHAWQSGEGIRESADLQLELKGLTGKPFAAVTVLEGGEAHTIYAGPVRDATGKDHVVAFAWTGAHDAELVIELSAAPIDPRQSKLRAAGDAQSDSSITALRQRLPRAR